MLTPWRKDRILVDPFCGSGTFPIEAAMMAANIAPGMNRSFLSEKWDNLITKKNWYDVIDEANDMICDDVEVDIQGYDVDSSVIKIARRNAMRGWSGSSDPFPGEGCKGSESSEEIWIYYYEPAVRRTSGR